MGLDTGKRRRRINQVGPKFTYLRKSCIVYWNWGSTSQSQHLQSVSTARFPDRAGAWQSRDTIDVIAAGTENLHAWARNPADFVTG